MTAREDWTAVTLGEVTNNFDARRRPVKSFDRVSGSFPYYGASGVVDYIDDYIFDGEYLLISEDGENLRSRSTPIAFLAHGKFWVNNHAHVVKGSKSADTRFLSHLLAITDVSGYLTGSTQPKLSRRALDSIQLLLPPISEQQAIAEVLGALDDKIAANSALIGTAEELAVALAALANGRAVVGKVAHATRSSVNPQTMLDAVVDHYSLPAFDAGRRPERVVPDEIKSSKFRLTRPAVLISKLNPRFPRVWDVMSLPDVPALASTEFVVLEPKDVSTTALWALLSQPSVSAAIQSTVAGTSGSHQRVKPDAILFTEIGDPATLGENALDQITALGQRAANARIESAALAATRDAILPGLMSGKLRVKDAERVAESLA